MVAQLLPITSLLLSSFFMLMGSGLAGILLPLRADMEGWSTTTIGWIGTGYAIAFTAGCLITPRLVRRVGHVRVFAVFATLQATAMLLHALVVDPSAWVLIRGITGFSIAGGYMVIESWLNERVSNNNRGLVFSIYMIVCMLGLMAGQFIMPLGDISANTLFMIAAILFGLAVVPTALSSAASPQPLTQVSLDIRGLFLRSPVALVGSFLAGFISGNWHYFAPVFGEMIGLSSFNIAAMMACAMIGGAVFQFPLGRASDKFDRRYVMVFAGIVGLILSAVIVWFNPTTPWIIFAIMFLLGSVLFPVYSLVVAHANDYAEADEFVKVSGSLLIIYGFGTMVGPQVGGRTMEIVGAPGLFASMAAGFALYAGYAMWRSFRRPALDPDERSDFQVIALTRQQTPQTFELDPRVDETPSEDNYI